MTHDPEPLPASAEPGPPATEPGFVERRSRPTPMFSRYTFLGGRRRSATEGESYVDLYDPATAALALVFFALTVFDAVATVYYIDHAQGTELNPLAQWMLDQGRMVFVFAKGVPTFLMLLFVMVHKNFRFGRMALAIGFSFYLLLAGWHLILQIQALVYVL